MDAAPGVGSAAPAAQHTDVASQLAKLADLKEALKGDDTAAISAKMNTLHQSSMKLGEAMYKQAEGGGGAGASPGGPDAGAGAKKDDVVDAEFTEVDDDKKNKKSA